MVTQHEADVPTEVLVGESAAPGLLAGAAVIVAQRRTRHLAGVEHFVKDEVKRTMGDRIVFVRHLDHLGDGLEVVAGGVGGTR